MIIIQENKIKATEAIANARISRKIDEALNLEYAEAASNLSDGISPPSQLVRIDYWTRKHASGRVFEVTVEKSPAVGCQFEIQQTHTILEISKGCLMAWSTANTPKTPIFSEPIKSFSVDHAMIQFNCVNGGYLKIFTK